MGEQVETARERRIREAAERAYEAGGNVLAAMEAEEDALAEEDHVRIAAGLRKHLDWLDALARQHESDARELRRRAERMREAINARQWWNVEGLLEDDQEILGECEPVGSLLEVCP